MNAELLQLCPTLCNSMDCSLPGSSVHGILQARTLEWVAISFSRGHSLPRNRIQISCIVGRFFTVWVTRSRKILIYTLEMAALSFIFNGLSKQEMAIHASILAWRIPWTEEPGSLQSMELQRVGHEWATNTLTSKPVWNIFLMDDKAREFIHLYIHPPNCVSFD